jgi:hypothetical protein
MHILVNVPMLFGVGGHACLSHLSRSVFQKVFGNSYYFYSGLSLSLSLSCGQSSLHNSSQILLPHLLEAVPLQLQNRNRTASSTFSSFGVLFFLLFIWAKQAPTKQQQCKGRCPEHGCQSWCPAVSAAFDVPGFVHVHLMLVIPVPCSYSLLSTCTPAHLLISTSQILLVTTSSNPGD